MGLWPIAEHNICQARVEEELNKLDAGAKESARLESRSISFEVQDLRRCLAKQVKLLLGYTRMIEEGLDEKNMIEVIKRFALRGRGHGTNMYQY